MTTYFVEVWWPDGKWRTAATGLTRDEVLAFFDKTTPHHVRWGVEVAAKGTR